MRPLFRGWIPLSLAALALACGRSAPAPTTVDVAVLELRVRARAADIAALKEKMKADTRHHPTRIAIAFDALDERMTALRLALDTIKAAGGTPTEEAQAEFDRAHDDLLGALRDFRDRYVNDR